MYKNRIKSLKILYLNNKKKKKDEWQFLKIKYI